MDIKYADLGPEKRLRDIVFAGSHDASVTSGNANVQTQKLDIAGQAAAGIRLFDLRILARTDGGSKGNKKGQLVGYHGGSSSKEKLRTVRGEKRAVTISKMSRMGGSFGLPLEGMLKSAKEFVEVTGEFLIFKFDKCTNWNLIAEHCKDVLKGSIYRGGGDVNRKTLDELKRKVIVVFSGSGLQEIGGTQPEEGILGIRNLYSKEDGPGSYDPKFNGIQYFGKGGTKIFGGGYRISTKIAENQKKQAKLMGQMAGNVVNHSSNVLGMMYWTATGATGSIRTRNKEMWKDAKVQKLQDMWEAGLGESMKARCAAKRIKGTSYSSGTWLKAFMPNIVMIDFASPRKCRKIYDLNTVASTTLTRAYQENKALRHTRP